LPVIRDVRVTRDPVARQNESEFDCAPLVLDEKRDLLAFDFPLGDGVLFVLGRAYASGDLT
jgi:hypothetical protein